jgi:hypothetical protein
VKNEKKKNIFCYGNEQIQWLTDGYIFFYAIH